MNDVDPCNCGGTMRPVVAIMQTWGVVPDFPGGEVVTISYGGPGKIVECLKFDQCGWSYVIDEKT